KMYKDNKFKIIKEEKVGAQIGSELKQDALLSILFGLIAIMLYMGFRFKFVFGFGAIISLFHDVVITLGVFSMFYGVFPGLNLEISITVIAALLTLIGYSVNDSVVIFDRIRENFTVHKTAALEENINKANNRTIRRTLVTGIGTILAIVALLVGGGDVLRGFSFTLLLGIVIGTYSSFLSSQIVYDYTVKMKKKMDF
ncbi:MAG: protein translocase subunit SecF, partial [Ignavibacteria bacterium]|nr:protein translocase subunit SecF [Ignavibacteria bacterium]